MVELFSRYPEHLIAEAVDPVHGMSSMHDFAPSLKQVKEFLEPRFQNHLRQLEQAERRKRQLLELAPPPPSAEAKARVQAIADEVRQRLGSAMPRMREV
jgi:hypothetical protein